MRQSILYVGPPRPTQLMFDSTVSFPEYYHLLATH